MSRARSGQWWPLTACHSQSVKESSSRCWGRRDAGRRPFRIVAGFESVDRGGVLIEGHDVLPLPPERRPVNLVFQRYALFPHLSVWDNVAFGLKVAGTAGDEVKRRVGDALASVRLDGYGQRRIDELSGGQQQRVAVARAVINRPVLLLLDEPLGALDLQLRKEMQSELRLLQRQIGTTFMYVTHDQEEALALSDTVVVMTTARSRRSEALRMCTGRPVSRFVAGFVGETNLLRGHSENGRLTLESADGSIFPAPAGASGAITISIRPEDLNLTLQGDSHLTGVLRSSIYLGHTMRHLVELKDGTIVKVDDRASGPGPSPEHEVIVSWHSADCVAVP